MAKKEKQKSEAPSIGALVKPKLTQRERNLSLKAQLIENGDHPEPTVEKLGSVKERNLFVKAKLKKQNGKD